MEDLREEITEEEIPCGTCTTTRHIDSAGTVVRQDIHIKVREGLLSGTEAGKIA